MVVPIMRVSNDKEIDVLDTTGLTVIRSSLKEIDLATASGDEEAIAKAIENHLALAKQYGYCD